MTRKDVGDALGKALVSVKAALDLNEKRGPPGYGIEELCQCRDAIRGSQYVQALDCRQRRMVDTGVDAGETHQVLVMKDDGFAI